MKTLTALKCLDGYFVKIEETIQAYNKKEVKNIIRKNGMKIDKKVSNKNKICAI